MNLIDKIKIKVEESVVNDSRILAVYLLGSAVRGALRPDSDIDLAVMFNPQAEMSQLERIELANNLSYELGRTVDIGAVSSKNLVYSREALLTGSLVYQMDSDKVNLIRSTLLGLYIQFNLDRKEILDAYRS